MIRKIITRICRKYDQEINIAVEEDREYVVEIKCKGLLIRRFIRRPIARVFKKKLMDREAEYTYYYIRFKLPRCSVLERETGEKNKEYYELEVIVYPKQ